MNIQNVKLKQVKMQKIGKKTQQMNIQKIKSKNLNR